MIRLDQVSVSYGAGAPALQPTSIDFHRGEFTVLLGASGAGKSTLLRCLNYLNKPTTGSVSVDGLGRLDDARVLHEHRRRTGMIFQQHQLIGRRSALHNVLVGRLGYHTTLRSLWPLPDDDQRIALESLARVGLLDKAMARVDSLSGGQQQRVGIARAMAQRPRLMLADEPVASLDPDTAGRVLALIKAVCAEDHIPAIVSLHQLELAKTFADRIVAIAQGRVVYDGVPEALGQEQLDAIYRPAPAAAEARTVPAYPALHLLTTEN